MAARYRRGVRSRPGEDRYAIYVWRSERYGGDTKTEKSRRTLALPQRCVEALRQHMERQEKERLRAGELWQEHGLVFASRIGTPLTANNVIRAFRIITKKAGLRTPDIESYFMQCQGGV
jgi:site-specific recombinase XerD